MPFTKFSEAPVKLQHKAKRARSYTSADTRKSFETYNQRMSANTQKEMANFMCHSEHTRDSDYRQTGVLQAVNVVANYEHMIDFYTDDRAANEFPAELSMPHTTRLRPPRLAQHTPPPPVERARSGPDP